METATLALTLTGLETVFLADSVANKDIAEGLPDRDAYVPLARQALLLLGGAYRELVTAEGIAPGPVTLQVSEEIAWLLRSKVRTGDLAIDGKTNVGIALLLKLYDLLNAFNADVSGLPSVSTTEGESMTDAKRWILNVAKEAEGDA